MTASGLRPADVHDTLRRHLLVDGYDLVLDLEASVGSRLVDARDGTSYLDLFTFFASHALGMNHPGLTGDEEFRAELLTVAVNKPSNSDIYSVPMARFVETFARVVGDPALPHLFFVEGGGLAVENAIKIAFDWKSRRNEAAGRSPELGTQVLHLTRAFHGRTGYTMSLTNTVPGKVARFPKFDWPRIDVPYVTHPLSENLAVVQEREDRALAQARAAFEANPHDIACFLAEPIQGEGGDHHLRPEFLQAMQALCEEFEALFVLDEVQSGVGLTGTAWAYQQLGITPDVVAFGKKMQVCGVMAGGRVDDEPQNVFVVGSRVNSTWGGNLTDMVRARRILEVIESDGLFANAAARGEHLLAGLERLREQFPALVSDVRGRGLMCALTLPDAALRDSVVTRLQEEEKVLLLGAGKRSLRFRPALCVTDAELDEGLAALGRVLATVSVAPSADTLITSGSLA